MAISDSSLVEILSDSVNSSDNNNELDSQQWAVHVRCINFGQIEVTCAVWFTWEKKDEIKSPAWQVKEPQFVIFWPQECHTCSKSKGIL